VKTSILRGDTFIRELLIHENETPFHEMFRLKRSTFHRLCSNLAKVGLTPTREISIAEQVTIFLYITANNASSRLTAWQFQHSSETISRYENPLSLSNFVRHFHNVLDSILRLYPDAVTLPSSTESLAARIADDPKYALYFQDCIGALDGCHVRVMVDEELQSTWRNRSCS
jgi:hypothetical protein